eukprot:TRINITY_DN57950_c0_g1_i1.p1 TRINITY_DN57950_c0_g1~~TRINITY_DN57950_c0_g1_i1.p1  ORF type:complete len:158 (-),score=44.21 TRINITY_DN57950_c0_g1_i1:52-525(-)
MDLLNMMPQDPNIPPEVANAFANLGGLDEKLRVVTLPLQRLQFICGYKQCFSGGASSSSGMLSSMFGSGSADGAAAQKTLACLERCEAPLQDFEQATERRMEGLIDRLEQCATSEPDEQRYAACVSRALDPSKMENLVKMLQDDVKNIQQKYNHYAE